MVEYIKGTLYSCICGYNTLSSKHACKHSKTKKCNGKTIEKRDVEFVLKEDHLAALGNTHPPTGNVTTYIAANTDNSINNTHNGDNNITNNVTLVLPERTTKEDFAEYLETLGQLGFRTPEQIATMPGKMLMFTRDAKKLPGAIVERNKKIIEKLPDGSERVMGKKKAIQTYTHEAVDALCLQPPAVGVIDFLETERGSKRTKISLQDAAKLRVTNPREYHCGVPEDVKFRHQKIESHTEKALDKITTENKTNGFL